MRNKLKKQLEAVDWEALGETKLPDWILAYASDDRQEHINAYHYFERRLESKIARPENYGPLSELLAREGLVYAVPILVSLLAEPNIQSKHGILDNLNEIAANIDCELTDSNEPYRSRALHILNSLKAGYPEYHKFADAEDVHIRTISRELLTTLSHH